MPVWLTMPSATASTRVPAGHDEVLQRRELPAAIVDLRVHRVEHRVERRHDGPLARDLGSADRRGLLEVELAALQLRDFRELLAERVEADELRLHATDAGGERRDLVVGILLDARELLALHREILVPARERELAERARAAPLAAGHPGAGSEGDNREYAAGVREYALHGHNVGGPLEAIQSRRTMPKKALRLKYFDHPFGCLMNSDK